MRVVVLFNLKPGIAVADYEDWARHRDIPGMRSLPSVDDYRIYRTTGLLGSGATAPYAYVEILDIADMDGFEVDARGTAAEAISAEFRAFLDGEPHLMLTEQLD